MAHEPVDLTLTTDEALVLFDLLRRWEGSGVVEPPRHEAEQIALWNLSAALESLLSAPFAQNYEDLVQRARQRLVNDDS
jgi:hypothetical protein